MRSIRRMVLLFIFVLLGACCKDIFPVLKGPYLGQTPPSDSAEIFAPDILSTGHIEKCPVFAPDGRAFYWSVLGDAAAFIAVTRQVGGHWREPEIVPFCGDYLDLDCALSPDGRTLYFSSEDRPVDRERRSDTNLWCVLRQDNGWSEPESLGPRVNSTGNEYAPTISADGTLVFYRREGEQWDIFYSEQSGGRFTEPMRFGPEVNSPHREFDPYIAPDGSFLIFCSVGRDDSYGAADLYISFRNETGVWSDAVNLGVKVNSERWEFSPRLSHDGQYLFFASNRRYLPHSGEKAVTFEEKMAQLERELIGPGNGHSDFYWIDARFIDSLNNH